VLATQPEGTVPATGVSGVTYGAEWRADLSSGTWTPSTDSVNGSPQIFLHLTVNSGP
jgi:hypothetical protein